MTDRDEIEALKARLAELEGPNRKPDRKSRDKVMWLLSAIVLGALVIPVFQFFDDDGLGMAEDTPQCNPDWARAKIADLETRRILEDTQVTSDGLIMLVNERRFAELTYPEKERAAVAIDCVVAGTGKHVSSVNFRTSLRGDDLVRFDGIDLLTARSGYASRGWVR